MRPDVGDSEPDNRAASSRARPVPIVQLSSSMSFTRLRQFVAVGLVALVLLVDFHLFYDFSFPFRYLWSEGALAELLLSVTLLLWSVLGSFLIFFSRRSLLRSLTLPFFLLFFLGPRDFSDS